MLSLIIKVENMYLVESLKILIKSQIIISTPLKKKRTFIIIKTALCDNFQDLVLHFDIPLFH